MKVETKIVMKVGGKTLEMSPDEARQLRDELNKVVGGPVYHYYPYTTPQWTWTTPVTTTTHDLTSAGPSATDTVQVYTVQ